MAGILTPIGFLYFPHLFTPKVNKQNPGQGPRFSALLLLDASGVNAAEYQNLRQAVYAAIVDKFGAAKANDQNFVRSLRLPFRPSTEKTYAGFTDGQIFFSAWTQPENPPGVVDLSNRRILDPKDVFGGQLARFTVRPFAYDNSGSKGVALGLEHVQIVKADMPRRDGGVAAEDAFAGTAASTNAQLAALGIDPNAAMGGYNTQAPSPVAQTAYQAPYVQPVQTTVMPGMPPAHAAPYGQPPLTGQPVPMAPPPAQPPIQQQPFTPPQPPAGLPF